MLATVMYGAGDVRFETVDDPKILKPTDAIIQLSATCICGSDLWPYRGAQPFDHPMHMGHEYCGVVIEISNPVSSSSARSFCLTTPARIADTDIRRPANNANSLRRRSSWRDGRLDRRGGR